MNLHRDAMQCANNATFFWCPQPLSLHCAPDGKRRQRKGFRNKPRKHVLFLSLSPLIVVKCAMIYFRLLSEYIECGKETKCVKNRYESSTYRTIG